MSTPTTRPARRSTSQAVLDGCGPDDQLYVCGPKVMLDAVLAQTHARGWTRERVHFEVFAPPVEAAATSRSRSCSRKAGRALPCRPARSVLDCLIEHGCDPMFDCKRGECGVCSTPVIEGEIDHRDYFLSESEKASGKVMQICVSRIKGARLVLDL